MLAIILTALIVPGLLTGYALIARPLLRKIPAFAAFYDQADIFWKKVWALTGNSATVAWGYLLAAIGGAMELVDRLGAALGDPSLNIKAQIMESLKDRPELIGYMLTGISLITILARLRGLMLKG